MAGGGLMGGIGRIPGVGSCGKMCLEDAKTIDGIESKYHLSVWTEWYHR